MSNRLVGLAEVAEMFGVSKQVVVNWRNRGVMPQPVAQLAAGPVWERPLLEAWAAETGREVVSSTDA